MKETCYRRYGHAKTGLLYHIIFVTKYRRKCLEGMHDDVIASFRGAESKSDFVIKTIESDKDHVHMLIEFKPSLSIEQVVRRLKQLTTHDLWLKDGVYLKRFYWSRNRHLWTNGYFCSTIGDVSEEVVKRYIENQG